MDLSRGRASRRTTRRAVQIEEAELFIDGEEPQDEEIYRICRRRERSKTSTGRVTARPRHTEEDEKVNQEGPGAQTPRACFRSCGHSGHPQLRVKQRD